MLHDGLLAVRELRHGHGTPLVLLHGFPLDSRMWADVVDLMPGEPQVLGIDFPGAGRSPVGADVAERLGTPAEPSIDLAADAVAATLRARGIDRAVVAGLSMGGYVALALVERHPDLVVGLGLLDTKVTADADDARANRLRIADQLETEQRVDAVLGMRTSLLGETNRSARPDLAARIETWIRDQGALGVAWAQRAMAARPDRSGVLGGYPGPVAVVVGEEDELSPPAGAREMASLAADSQLVVVPRAGHMTAIESPEPVASALSTLLRRAAAGR